MTTRVSILDLGPAARRQVLAILEGRRIAAEMRAPKPSKYRATRCEVDGERFDSQAERDRWLDLRLMERAGQIAGLRRQVPFECVVNGIHVCKWVADFEYREIATGTLIREDVKGVRTAVYRLKKRLVAACCGFDIKEIQA